MGKNKSQHLAKQRLITSDWVGIYAIIVFNYSLKCTSLWILLFITVKENIIYRYFARYAFNKYN